MLFKRRRNGESTHGNTPKSTRNASIDHKGLFASLLARRVRKRRVVQCRFGGERRVMVARDDRDWVRSRETGDRARGRARGGWERRECTFDDEDAWSGSEDTGGEHGGREGIV